MGNEVLGKCINPFTGEDNAEVRISGKHGRAYLVTPWGPFSSTARGFDQYCRGLVKVPAVKPDLIPEPVPGAVDPVPPPVKPEPPAKKPAGRRFSLGEFLP